jgi:hypothetical protein
VTRRFRYDRFERIVALTLLRLLIAFSLGAVSVAFALSVRGAAVTG